MLRFYVKEMFVEYVQFISTQKIKNGIIFALRLFSPKILDEFLEYFIHSCQTQKKRPLAQKSETINQLN